MISTTIETIGNRGFSKSNFLAGLLSGARAKVARRLVFACLSLLLSTCASRSMVFVESTNQNSRIDYIVIHATSEDFAESLRLLSTRTSNPVSAHYLIPEPDDASYPHRSLRVYSLVPEMRRAWHAGRSYWHGEDGLNDRSIGIELVNDFDCTASDKSVVDTRLKDVSCDFLPYSEEQIELLVELLEGILGRYPGINPIDIVGHSDIAIMRRSDPGPLFPWQALHEAGIGAWPDTETTEKYRRQFSADMPNTSRLQEALAMLGYQIEITGEMDSQTEFVVRAFQLHFRPTNYSGRMDSETAALLWSLLEKYRARELASSSLMP